MKKERGAIFIL